MESITKEIKKDEVELVVNAMQDGLCTISGDRIEFMNAACERIFGYTREELSGISISELILIMISEEDQHWLIPKFVDARDGVELVEIENPVKFISKAGKDVYVQMTASYYSSDSRKIVITFKDITERELLLKTLKNSELYLNKMSDALVVVNANCDILQTNGATSKLWGYTEKEMVGLSVFELFPESERSTHEGEMKYCIDGNTSTRFETIALTHRNEKIPIELTGEVVRNDNGELLGFVAVVRDIRSRKEIKDKIRKSEEILLLAAKAAKIGYYNWDLVEEDLEWDVKMHELFELDVDATGSRFEHFNKMIHPEDSQEVETAFKHGLSPDCKINEFSNDFRIVSKKTGKVRHIEFNSLHFRDEEGNVIRIVGTCSDITEQKAMQEMLRLALDSTEQVVLKRTEELVYAKEKLEESLEKEKLLGEMKSKFVSVASHQFRTPLSVIQSNLGLLSMLKDGMSEEIRPRFDKIHSQVKDQIRRMTLMMDRALLLGKINDKTTELNFEPVDLHKLCLELEETFSQIHEGDRVLRFETVGEMYSVELDYELVKQGISNLVSNAFKYSKGKASPLLYLDFSGPHIQIKVIDEGIGIPKGEVELVFSPFNRGSNAEQISGTGLGTSIAKEYLEKNGAVLEVQSEVGKGTTITITFMFAENVF